VTHTSSRNAVKYEIHGKGGSPPIATQASSQKKLSKLLDELSDLDGTHQVSDGTSLISGGEYVYFFLKQFGARESVWVSLACDYLAASSVSSERAFSSARITINKRRNRLKGKIVEVLQFLKCLFRKNLIVREVLFSSMLMLKRMVVILIGLTRIPMHGTN